jgi:hypothetical protein
MIPVLPIVISFLIGFLAFKNPKLGMIIGSFLVGVSLIYHLASIDFISGLAHGENAPAIRLLFILVVLGFFIFAPAGTKTHEEAIAIAIGIMASMLLFSPVTYYLAVPLILMFSVLFKRKQLVLTLAFYLMISFPVQTMQYVYDYNQLPIPDRDKPGEHGLYPLLYGNLTYQFKPIEPFDLGGIANATKKISENVVGEYNATVGEAIDKYIYNLPGITTFLVVVFGLISTSAFATITFLRILKRIEHTRKYARYVEIFLPTITAVVFIQIFWFLSLALRAPLSIAVKIDPMAMVVGTIAIVSVTLPFSAINHILRVQALIEELSRNLLEKTQKMLSLLQTFKEKLKTVKSNVPIPISPIEGKVSLIEDKLTEISSRASKKTYDLPTIYEKLEEMEKVNGEIGTLSTDLNVSLEEFYTRMSYEFLGWLEKLKDLEIEAEKNIEIANANDFRSMTIEARVDVVKNVLEAGRLLTREVLGLFKEIYSMIRSIYDQKLPVESSTEKFAQHTLEEETLPWIALESLLAALQNFERQYGSEVSKSIQNLQSSLSSIVNLGVQGEMLLPILGDDAVRQMLDLAKKGDEIIKKTEKKKTSIMKVTLVKEALQSTLGVSAGILQTLYAELDKKEKMIESLLPTREYEWGKNTFIREKLETVIDIISNPSKHNLDVVMDNLYKSLAYIETCIDTISAYSEEQELLLNYPIAELVIENILEREDQVTAGDLPFKFEYAREYLRLYSRQKYAEVSFDDSSNILRKRVLP